MIQTKEVTNIDFAAVLRYYGFHLVTARPASTSKRGSGKLTAFVFQVEHPQGEMQWEDVHQKFLNEQLEVEPGRILTQSRLLRNLSHNHSQS